MRYSVKNKNYEYIKDDELLKSILLDRGVEEPEKLINIDESCQHSAKLF